MIPTAIEWARELIAFVRWLFNLLGEHPGESATVVLAFLTIATIWRELRRDRAAKNAARMRVEYRAFLVHEAVFSWFPGTEFDPQDKLEALADGLRNVARHRRFRERLVEVDSLMLAIIEDSHFLTFSQRVHAAAAATFLAQARTHLQDWMDRGYEDDIDSALTGAAWELSKVVTLIGSLIGREYALSYGSMGTIFARPGYAADLSARRMQEHAKETAPWRERLQERTQQYWRRLRYRLSNPRGKALDRDPTE